jgi:hypothetical protein
MLVVLLGTVAALAGDNPYAGKISKFVLIETEQVKPGQEMTFHKSSLQFKEAAAACADCYYLSAFPLTGQGGAFGWLVFENSWAGIEKTIANYQKVGMELAMKNASFMSDVAQYSLGAHFSIAEFQPDLSYQPDKIEGPQATCWKVTTFQIRPGTASAFTDLVKEALELHKKANDANAHWITYRYAAGTSGPTYMMVTPMKTLAEMDEEQSPAMKALMTPLMRKHFDDIVQKAVINFQTNLYKANPTLSRPPQSYVAANPDFWTVKAPEAVVAKSGKKAKKTVEPTAMKEKK